MVTGGSYGGYMTLATATTTTTGSRRIDIVGISNFVTFLENTESYRRDLRRVEYGDERDPEMREFLERISPLNNARRSRSRCSWCRASNDPRVPWTRGRADGRERSASNGTPGLVPARRGRGPRLRQEARTPTSSSTRQERLRATGRPEVLKINGTPELVLQDVRAYERAAEETQRFREENRALRERLGELETLRALDEAHAEMERGEGRPMEEALPALRERLGMGPAAA
jgi:hypothetical protein